MRRIAIGIAVVGVLALSGCGKIIESTNDSPVTGKDDLTPAEIIAMPDGFSNVSTKCDRHGNRIYTAFHGTNAAAAIFVVPADPSCAK